MERPPAHNRDNREKSLLAAAAPALIRANTLQEAEDSVIFNERKIYQKKEEIKRLRELRDKYDVGGQNFLAASNKLKDAEMLLSHLEENIDNLQDRIKDLRTAQRIAVGHQRPRNRDERPVVSDSDVPDNRPPSVHSSMDHVPHEAPAALGSVRSLTPPPERQEPAQLDPDPDSPPEVKFEPRPEFPGPELYAAAGELAGQAVGGAMAAGRYLLGGAAAAARAAGELAVKKKREYDEARAAKRARDEADAVKRRAEAALEAEVRAKAEEERRALQAEHDRQLEEERRARVWQEAEERERLFRQEQAAAALRHQDHLRRRGEAVQREAHQALLAAQEEMHRRAEQERIEEDLEAEEHRQVERIARESALQFAQEEAAREQQAIAEQKRQEDEMMNRLAREQAEALARVARARDEAPIIAADPVAHVSAGSLPHDPSDDDDMQPSAGHSLAGAARPATLSRGSSAHSSAGAPPPLPPRPEYKGRARIEPLDFGDMAPIPTVPGGVLPHDPEDAAATLVDMSQPPSVHRSRKRESQKRPRNLHLPVDVAPVPPPRPPPRSPDVIYASMPPPPRSPELETEPIERRKLTRKKGRTGGGGGGGGAQIIPMRDPEEAQREIRAEVQKIVDERAEEKRVRKASTKAKAAAKKTVVINVPAPVQEQPTQLVPVPVAAPVLTASVPPVEYHPLPPGWGQPSYSPYRQLMQQHAMALPHDPDEPDRTHPRMMQQTMYW